MIEQKSALEEEFHKAAIDAIQSYAPGILSAEILVAHIRLQWELQQETEPAPELLRRIAQRECSHALCRAWQSPDPQVHERASTILIRLLRVSLQRTRYADALADADYAIEEILQETLLDMQRGYRRESAAGPADPAAFLKWSQTILVRHTHVFIQKVRRDRGRYVSLEAQIDEQLERSVEHSGFIDPCNHDPLDEVMEMELQQALKDAILSLHNPRYRDVLLNAYLVGLDEGEMSRRLGVPIQQIYVWKCRALGELRKNPDIICALRSLRE